MKKISIIIMNLIFVINVFAAEPNEGAELKKAMKTNEEDTWYNTFALTGAVPAIKMVPGEDFRLFDGAAGGLMYRPFKYKDYGLFSAAHISLLGLISTMNVPNEETDDPDDRTNIYVFSTGIVIGLDWLQFGFGYDRFSSNDDNSAWKERGRDFFMINLQGSKDLW